MKIIIAISTTCLAHSGCAQTRSRGPLMSTNWRRRSGSDPVEARRATEISYSYSRQLKQNWNVTDSAMIHNAKVISGFRERGFCYDWAQSRSTPLCQENFGTLDLHRATLPPTALRIIHHSALIS